MSKATEHFNKFVIFCGGSDTADVAENAIPIRKHFYEAGAAAMVLLFSNWLAMVVTRDQGS